MIKNNVLFVVFIVGFLSCIFFPFRTDASTSWSPIFTDNFNRSDGGISNGWTGAVSTANVSSDTLVVIAGINNPWVNSVLLRPVNEVTVNQRAQITFLAGSGGGVYLSLRTQTAGTEYVVGYSSANTLSVFSSVGGTLTSLATDVPFSPSINSAHSYRIDANVVGTNPTVITATATDLNTSAVVATITATDSTASLQQNGQIGFFGYNTANLDDFSDFSSIASGYTLSGPSTAITGLSTPAFTVTPNGIYNGTLSLSDGGTGGIFSPSSLIFSSTSAAQTFIYTPASAGTKTISVTSNPSITDAAPLSLSVTNPAPYYYSDNFDSDTAGSLPAGWTNISPATWQVGTTGAISGSHGLYDPTFHANGTAVYTGTSSVADSAGQISQIVNIPGGGNRANSGIYLRLSSDGNNGYLFAPDFHTSPATVSIFKKVGGSFTTLDNYGVSAGATFSTGDVAIIKAEVSGTTIRWKMWKSGSAEPASWAESVTDSSVTAPGYIGVYSGGDGADGTLSSLDDIYWGVVGAEFAPLVSTSFTLTGPTFGGVNASSSNFTVTPNGAYTGTITPQSTGSGVFSPTSLTFTNSALPQTFTYTPTTRTGSPHVISATTSPALINSSGSISYTVTNGSQNISVNDPSLQAGLSPYNWYVSGSSYIQSVNPGAYFKVKFGGTSVALNVDVSALNDAGIPAKEYPQIAYQIDNGAWQTHQLLSTDSSILLGSSLTDATHSLEVIFLSSDVYVSKWNGTMSLKITGLTIDAGNSLSTAVLNPARMLIFGDSITEGEWVLGNTTDLTNASLYEVSTSSYAAGVANDLGAEYGSSAFGGQAWDSTFNSDVPSLPNAWNYYFGTNSRLSGGLLSPAPNYILVNMGTNGGLGSASTLSSWLTAVRAAAGTSTKIFVLVPFNGSASSNIISGFNSYVSASSDANVFLINLGSNGSTYSTTVPTYSFDGLHPNLAGQAQLRTLVSDAVQSNVVFAPVSVIASSTAVGGTITWNTPVPASSQIYFGLTSAYSTSTSETDTSTMVTNHTVALSGLLPCSLYHYLVQSINTAASVATSTDQTFITSGCTGNASVSNATSTLVNNTGGSVTLGAVSLSAPPSFAGSASATLQIKQLDPVAFAAAVGAPSSERLVGTNVFNLEALTDATTALSSFNQPVSVTFTYSPSDIVGLAPSTLSIYHYHNGAWSPLSNCIVNASTHTVQCQTTSFSDFALFGSTPPSVSVTLPVSSSTVVGSSVSLVAIATDTVGVAGVQFILDGVTPIGSLVTSTTSPNTYATTWDSTSASNASHVIYAVAEDTSGNYATSSVSVTVDNALHIVGGNISGLSGTVVLEDNGGDNVTISSNGSFSFATGLHDGVSYDVTVLDQPSGQTCSVGSGAGIVSSGNVTNISVSCVSNTVNQNPVTPTTSPTASTQSYSGGGGSVSASVLASLLAPGATTTAYLKSLGTVSVSGCPVGFVCTLNPVSTIVIATSSHSLASTLPQAIMFSRNLQLGMTGNDVKHLQIFLNAKKFTISQNGAGSPGHETIYFGPATKSALISFQKANNIIPAVGYFGPITRAIVNQSEENAL